MKHARVAAGEKYVRDVIAGRIPACEWVRAACRRHRDDKKRSRGAWPYKFDPAKAERAIRFIEYLPHVKGEWANRKELLQLQPWQVFMVMSLFGWVVKSGPRKGKRRFTTAYLIVPRKNGKSALAAGIGLYMFAAEGEAGAEVYCGATTQKQALIVHRMAWMISRQEKDFAQHYGVVVPQSVQSFLTIPDTGARMGPVIGKPGDGDSVSCAIVDEYHEHASSEQYDALKFGMSARSEPLMLVITTAGHNLGGPCHASQLDLQKILSGVVEDDNVWGIIYTIDAGDDWATEEALRKANPNFGISVNRELVLSEQRAAIRDSRRQGEFQTKHLNVWVGTRTAFFNIERWDGAPKSLPEENRGRPLYLGVDLASKKDIASVVGMFDLGDNRYAAFGRHYTTEESISGESASVWAGWARDGYLIACDGDMIDYGRIEEDILALEEKYTIRKLAFDPAYAWQLTQRLMDHGIECVQVRPSVMNFSEPMKTLDALILAGRVAHEHSPAMRWMMSNVVAKVDNKDGVYPNKEKPESKIDGAVALIMAGALAFAAAEEEEPSYAVTIID